MRQHVDRKPFVSPSVLCGLLVVSSWSWGGLPGSAGGPESSFLVVSWRSPDSFQVVSWSSGAVRCLFLSDLPLLKHSVREAEAFPNVLARRLGHHCNGGLWTLQRGLQERENVFPPCLAFVYAGSIATMLSHVCLVVSRLVMSPRPKCSPLSGMFLYRGMYIDVCRVAQTPPPHPHLTPGL